MKENKEGDREQTSRACLTSCADKTRTDNCQLTGCVIHIYIYLHLVRAA